MTTRGTMGETRRPATTLTCLVALLSALAIACFAAPAQAHADIAKGSYGECNWSISDDGVLTIGPGNEVGNFSSTKGDGKYQLLSTNGNGGPWSQYASSITSVVVEDDVVAGRSCSAMFANLNNCRTMNLSKLDVSSVEDTSAMFKDCSNLTSLDISGWDTSSLRGTGSMFMGCSKLPSVDVSGWNTSSVTDTDHMFNGCTDLTSLDVSKWDTSAMEDMIGMFVDCSKLQSLDVSRWNTSSLKDISSTFHRCSSLTSLDLSKWDTSSVTSLENTFGYCSNLTELNLSGWNTSSVETLSSTFQACSNLSNLDLSGWDTSSVMRMHQTFNGCSKLAKLDLSGWDTSKVTDMSGIFDGCKQLTSINLSGWDTSSIKYMGYMFDECYNLRKISLSKSFNLSNTDFGELPLNGWHATAGTLIDGTFTAAQLADRYSDAAKRTDTTWEAPVNAFVFTDANAQTPHFEDIFWFASKGITTGYANEDGTYRYEGMTKVFRQDMAAFLRREAKLLGILDADSYVPSDADWNAFTDVNKNTPHAEDILWMYHEGISTGYANGDGTYRFEGMTPVFRQDMAAFLHRMINRDGSDDGMDTSRIHFTDVNESTPHYKDILWLAASGVTTGYDNGDGTVRFEGTTYTFRQDMAAFLHRFAAVVPD
jgi:surface protein